MFGRGWAGAGLRVPAGEVGLRVAGAGARGDGPGVARTAARGVHEHAPAFRDAAPGGARGTDSGRATGEGVDRVEATQVAQGAGVLFRRGGAGTAAEQGTQKGEELGDEGAGEGGAGGGAEQEAKEHEDGGQDGIERTRFSCRPLGGAGRLCAAGPFFVHDLF